MTIKKIIGAAALMGVMASANAASLSLVYVGENDVIDGVVQADIGDQLSFELIADFSGTTIINGEEVAAITLGGGYDVNFDSSIMEFVSFDNAVLGDPAFNRSPDAEDGRLFNGGFGDFNGITGPDLVGTITFIAAAGGDSSIQTSATDGFAGPFVSGVDFVSLLDVDFQGVDVAVVPVPAAVWFMLSGLGALVGFGRKSA